MAIIVPPSMRDQAGATDTNHKIMRGIRGSSLIQSPQKRHFPFTPGPHSPQPCGAKGR